MVSAGLSLHITAAVLMAAAFVLHVICIGTPSFVKSDTYRPLRSYGNGSKMPYPAMYERDLQYGMFRLCSDACLYEDLKGDYECSFRRNNFRRNESGMGEWCYSLAPATSKELYGDNAIQAPDWLIAAQALSIVGLITLPMGALVIIACMQCCNRGDKGGNFHTYALIIGVSFITAGVVSIISDIIYGTQYHRLSVWDGDKDYYEDVLPSDIQELYDEMMDLYWGFWLDVAAGVMAIVAGIFSLIGNCIYADHREPRTYVNNGY